MPEVWDRLADATAYAFRIHAGQVRKGTTIPYISHLISVSALVLEDGGDEDLAIAGLLHDAIEDVGAEEEAVIQATRGSGRPAGPISSSNGFLARPPSGHRDRELR